MSLEEALNRHATAIENLADALEKISARGTMSLPAEVAATQSPRGPGRPPKAAAAVPAQGANGEDGKPIAYDTVREAVLSLAEKKGHQVAVGLLAEFGAKNGKDLKPAQYAKALARVNELMGESVA